MAANYSLIKHSLSLSAGRFCHAWGRRNFSISHDGTAWPTAIVNGRFLQSHVSHFCCVKTDIIALLECSFKHSNSTDFGEWTWWGEPISLRQFLPFFIYMSSSKVGATVFGQGKLELYRWKLFPLECHPKQLCPSRFIEVNGNRRVWLLIIYSSNTW